MRLDDVKISRAIIESYNRKLLGALEADVAIVGAGPAGLVCGYYLARQGCRVVLFERKLSVGGGMWGGGMMFNEIVVQREAREILDELGVRTRRYEGQYYLADSIEAVTTICSRAVKAGLRVFNLLSVEDILVRAGRVGGLVLNWTAVEMGGLHVDPLTMSARFVVDATGHAAEVARLAERKSGLKLRTKTGKIVGEKSMWADRAERLITSHSREVAPGLYVCGMCANAVFGGPRMGPIFGGMLLSGRHVARALLRRLSSRRP